MERPRLVYTSLPDAQTALALAEDLVRERLAACVFAADPATAAWLGAETA